MTLGKKLKTLRADNNFSQPELAEKIGIEQSYLSKLENDKSVPSNDIFNKILTAFNLTLEQFLVDFKSGADIETLRQIPDIAQHFSNKQKLNIHSQRRFLYVASFLIVLATTLFYVGFSKQVFSGLQYFYVSEGIVKPGEPPSIFSNWMRLTEHEKLEKKRIEMAQRKLEHVLITRQDKGEVFVVDVEGGKRQYHLDRSGFYDNPINAWLQVLGVLLFSAGIMGFVLERRLFKTY